MQMSARYGVGKVAGEQMLYTVTLSGVTYQGQIFFDPKGYVSMEIYSRKNPDGGTDDAPLAEMTQADFDLLLAEEESAVPWRPIDATPEKRTWIAGTNRAFARYEAKNRLFLFFSPGAQPFVPTSKIMQNMPGEGK